MINAERTPVSDGPMPDVQGKADGRNVAIDKVGVKGVTYPIRLHVPSLSEVTGPCNAALLPTSSEQTTVATISMYVALPATQKGTHMSRFLEVLNEQTAAGSPAITPARIPEMTRAIAQRLHAPFAHFSGEFVYFIRKAAPVTGMAGLMDYRASFACTAQAGEQGSVDLVMGLRAPATSLCPCSKEISAYGAHNQRCEIEARVRTWPQANRTMWLEELAATLEGAASEQVYSILKRPDEKHVTEGAYDSPKFVEDIIRDLALAMDREQRVAWYEINSENFESIHSHNAYARITRAKDGWRGPTS
jgi:GTP cyclohydrolase I